jgi:cysteine-rich repeat protein
VACCALLGCTTYDSSLLVDATPSTAGGAAGAGGGSGVGTGGKGGAGTGGSAEGGTSPGGSAGTGGSGGKAGTSSTGGKGGSSGAGGGGKGGSAGNGAGGASGGSGGASGGSGGGASGASGGSGGASAGGTGGSAGGSTGGASGGSAGMGGAGGKTCSVVSQCDDANPCTADACTGGACQNTADDSLKPPKVVGNCHAEICMGGSSASTIDDADLPADDGNPCTQETCTQGVSGSTNLGDGTTCMLSGGSAGVCKSAKCIVPCGNAAACDDGNPCTVDTCGGGLCSNANLADGTTTPGADMAADCHRPICMGGVSQNTVDTSDTPADQPCKKGTCSGAGVASLVGLPDGTACGAPADDTICKAAACAANTCGDGFKGLAEVCEGLNLNGKSCLDYGFGSPAGLTCNASCTFDSTGCKAVCGNNAIEAGETCDGGNATPGDGCSAYCQPEPKVGDLVITEIMFNPLNAPVSGSTELGEWFEVYNASASAIDLRGLVIVSGTSSGGTEQVTISSTTPVILAAGAYGVLAKADKTMNGGTNSLYVYGSLTLSNSAADYVALYIGAVPGGTLLDQAGYTASDAGKAAFNGASFSLDPTKLSIMLNDVDTNFCAAKTAMPDLDKGTPGAANDSCP